MKANLSESYIYSHKGENRFDIRYIKKYTRRNKKSYFILPNEVIEKYRAREISAVDVKIFAYLSSLSMRKQNGYSGVKVSQCKIALRCAITEKTVGKSVERLYNAGLIRNVISETKKHHYKKETTIYFLKPLPTSGFFFVPRYVFTYGLKPKEFTVYLFLCKAQSFEYEKSWNSFNDICHHLGFGKGSRSEVMKLIGKLVTGGFVKKTVRRIKNVFVDNIYRVINLAESMVKKAEKKEKRSVSTRTQFSKKEKQKEEKSTMTSIIHLNSKNVNLERKNCEQLQLSFEDFFMQWGVGCDFTDNILTKKERIFLNANNLEILIHQRQNTQLKRKIT